MPATSLNGFSKSSADLFTPDEVRKLMRIEFARAARHGLPLACLMLQVDRLDAIATVHGHEAKLEILQCVVELLKNETRSTDLLGYPVDDRLVVLLPHTNQTTVVFLCKRVLEQARALQFRTDAGTVRITLSIGIAHNRRADEVAFETLERVAEEGLVVADAGGGDRYAETQLYQLYERKRHTDADARGGGLDYRDRLEELVSRDGDLERAASEVAEEIVTRLLREAEEQRPAREDPGGTGSDREADHVREIENLQRRLAKLTESLGITEGEIARLRGLEDVDDGVASIYRQVQGLCVQDLQAELKRELMKHIFEANLDLKKRTA